MPEPPRLPSPRYRRRILAAGLIAAGALFSFIAPVYIRHIEGDLEQRVPDELADAGFDGVTAEFSGQDGSLSCEQPLTDPEAATDVAYGVWGVRAITLDRSCRVNVGGSAGEETSADAGTDTGEIAGLASVAAESASSSLPTTTAEYASINDLLGNDDRFSYLSMLIDESGLATELGAPATALTLFAPTDDAFDQLSADANATLRSDPELLTQVLRHHIAAEPLPVAELSSGSLTMTDGSDVHIVSDGSSPTVDGIALVDTDLMAGPSVVHGIDGVLIPAGVQLDQPVQTSQPGSSAPGSVPSDTQPPPPVVATPEQAAALTDELNAYVTANPLRFQPAQAVLSPESAPILDHIAERLLATGGIAVTIEGHTDSDGTPDRNLALSQQRAEVVLLELVARGVSEVPLTAEGFGSERPVLVNGVEDKDASRRVEFRVQPA